MPLLDVPDMKIPARSDLSNWESLRDVQLQHDRTGRTIIEFSLTYIRVKRNSTIIPPVVFKLFQLHVVQAFQVRQVRSCYDFYNVYL